MKRGRRTLAIVLVVSAALLPIATPSSAQEPDEGPANEPTAVAAPAPAAPDISIFEDLGAWIDIYDAWAFDRPQRTVRKAARYDVTTLYVETSNFSRPYAIYQPTKMARLIKYAHRKNINVVAWYLPGLLNLSLDYKRTMAAIRFHRNGQRFDGFGLDIEASDVKPENLRSDRLVKLSRRIASNTPNNFPLGAIIPSPRGMQLVKGYWENFPYKRLVPHYDVWLPMGYYTYRVKGRKDVYDYTRLNTEILRDETNDPNLPIHAIGGIAHKSNALETRGFTQAVLDDGILGGGLYDMGLMGPEDWKELKPLA